MLWHPKTLQNLAMYNVFFIFGRFSIAGKLPKWPKFHFNTLLRSDTQKSSKNVENTTVFWSRCETVLAPPAKADIATAILTNVIEHLVLLLPPNKHAFTAKAVWADFRGLKADQLLNQLCQWPSEFFYRGSDGSASRLFKAGEPNPSPVDPESPCPAEPRFVNTAIEGASADKDMATLKCLDTARDWFWPAVDVLGVWELCAQPGSTEAGAVPAVSNCSSPGCLSGRVAHNRLRGKHGFCRWKCVTLARRRAHVAVSFFNACSF